MTQTMPQAVKDMAVVHTLARRMYLSFCEKKGWEPHPAPYVDAGSIRSAQIAVDYLGYPEDVLDV